MFAETCVKTLSSVEPCWTTGEVWYLTSTLSKLIKPVCVCICVIVVQFGAESRLWGVGSALVSLQFIFVQTWVWAGGQAKGTNLRLYPRQQIRQKKSSSSCLSNASPSSFSQIRDRRVPLLLRTNTSTASCVPVPGSLKAGGEEGGGELLIGAHVSLRDPQIFKQTCCIKQTHYHKRHYHTLQFAQWGGWRPDHKLRLHGWSYSAVWGCYCFRYRSIWWLFSPHIFL